MASTTTTKKAAPAKKTAASSKQASKSKTAKSTPSAAAPATSSTAASGTIGRKEFRDDFPIANLVKNPNNPRHRAVADDAMIESIRNTGIVEPVVVAPHDLKGRAAEPERCMTIAGHRRIDGAKKAGLTTVPVLIRRDLVTEAQQLEAMLVENLQREGLTPIEEAEGYKQLELFGYKQAEIAAAVGTDVKTVRTRLKLLKLSPSTKKKVHAGQMTLENATVMVEFADDPETTKRLEQAAKSSSSYALPEEIRRARRLRDVNREIASRRAKLLDAGATQLEVPEGQTVYSLTGVDLVRLSDTPSLDWGQHKKCLAFCEYEGYGGDPQLHELCTNPSAHRAQATAETRKREAEQEAQQKAEEERTLAQAAAADRRVDTLAALAEGAKLPDVIADLARVLLPVRVWHLSGTGLEQYQRLVGVALEDRWPHLGYHNNAPIHLTRFRQHLEDLYSGTATYAAKALVAYLVASAEAETEATWNVATARLTVTYFDLLVEAGHDLSDIDTALLGEHQKTIEKAAGKPAAKAAS